MVWPFNSPSSNESTPPLRSTRKKCWESRDKFFACLDGIGVENALDSAHKPAVKKNCSSQEAEFDRDCAASWVKYFKEQRYYSIKKEKFIKEMEEQGGTEIPIPQQRK